MLEILTGGVSGLIGSVVTSYANYKTQKLANEHKTAMAKIDLQKLDKEREFMLAEAEANMRITEVQTEAQMDIADSQAYSESIKQAQKEAISDKLHEKLLEGNAWSRAVGIFIAFIFGLVDFLKRIVRPGLTIYLVGLTTWITVIAVVVMEKQGSAISAAKAVDIFDDVTTIVIYLTVTCVTWWFGDRRMAKFLTRLNDGNIKNQASLKK